MWVDAWLMLWFTSVVFTICAFIWRRHVLFALLAAVFWLSLAAGMYQLDFFWAGDTNPITYDVEMGDHSGDVGIFILFACCGLVMLIYSIYNGLLIAKGEVKGIGRGELFEDI